MSSAGEKWKKAICDKAEIVCRWIIKRAQIWFKLFACCLMLLEFLLSASHLYVLFCTHFNSADRLSGLAHQECHIAQLRHRSEKLEILSKTRLILKNGKVLIVCCDGSFVGQNFGHLCWWINKSVRERVLESCLSWTLFSPSRRRRLLGQENWI